MQEPYTYTERVVVRPRDVDSQTRWDEGYGAPGGAAGGGGNSAGIPLWDRLRSLFGRGGQQPAATSRPYSSPGVYDNVFGGAGQATSGATTGPAVPPPAANTSTAARLGSLFNSRGAGTVANTALAVYGQRSQNQGNRQAQKQLLDSQVQQLDLERARLAAETRNADLDRDEQRALNTAMMDLDRRRFALEEQRLQFDRESEMFDRDQVTQENTRLAPYRQISTSAAQRLASMWGLS